MAIKKMSWDQAMEKLADEQRVIEDHLLPMSAWEPTVFDGQFGLTLKSTGKFYKPTAWAMKKMAGLSNGCREFDWLAENPIHQTSVDKATGEPKVLYQRDSSDAELMKHYVNTLLFNSGRLDQNKTRLFRTWSDGTLRSVLSKDYQKVDNRWYMETIRAMFPDGSIIRWRGDADTLQFEVTLEGLTKFDDVTGYGGIVHVGNSEIGQRAVIAHLGILRFICTNGAFIMEKLASMHKRHFGDLVDLKAMVVSTILKGKDMIGPNIDKMMGLKNLKVGDVPLRNVFAQLGIDNKMRRKHIAGIWDAWMKELGVAGAAEAQTAFGLQQAITRFSQDVGRDQSFAYDQMAGDFLKLNEVEWERFISRAKNLTDKQINNHVGELALVA